MVFHERLNRNERDPLPRMRTAPPSAPYAEPMAQAATAPPRSKTLAQRLSPANIVAFAMLASIPVKLLTERLSDPDLWWHLRTGQLIAFTHHIPHADVYSYTVPGKPWVVQEWLSEIIMHGLQKAFGLYGILAFRAVVVFTVYAIVAWLFLRKSGNTLATWTLFGLSAYAGSVNWTERPNILSFLLFAITLVLIERGGRAIWWFVPLSALWANLHGMVLVGIGLIGVLALCEWVKVPLKQKDQSAEKARRYSLVTIGSIVATMANPAGPRFLTYSLRLVGAVRDLVTEWASPNFHDLGQMIFLLLIIVAFVVFALNRREVDLTDLVLVVVFMVLALQAVRNLALSSIVIGLTIARYMPAIGTSRASTSKELTERSSTFMGAFGLAAATLGLLVVLIHGFPRSDRFGDIVNKSYPVATIDRLNDPGVRVFVLDVWSGMVIDRAWPNAHVYSDLRTDLYGAAFIRKYQQTISAFPGSLKNLDSVCTTHVLIRPKDALAQVLRLDPDWRVVQSDTRTVLFARARPAPGCDAFPIPAV